MKLVNPPSDDEFSTMLELVGLTTAAIPPYWMIVDAANQDS